MQEREEATRRNLLLNSLPNEYPMMVSSEEDSETEPATAVAAAQPPATTQTKTTKPPRNKDHRDAGHNSNKDCSAAGPPSRDKA